MNRDRASTGRGNTATGSERQARTEMGSPFSGPDQRTYIPFASPCLPIIESLRIQYIKSYSYITATRIHLQRPLYLNEVGNVVHFAYEQHMDHRRSVAHQSTYAHLAWCRR